jgi:hypothetical protein
MAEIALKGQMKVKTLKAEFKEAFGSTLRVYKSVTCKGAFADDEATLASIRAEGAKTINKSEESACFMKYRIELSVNGWDTRLFLLDQEHVDEALNCGDSLKKFYRNYVENWDDPIDPDFERYYITSESDDFILEVKDENGETIYELNDVDDYISNDKTEIEDEDGYLTDIDGYEFVGIEDGMYLVRIASNRNCSGYAEIELDHPFNPDRLYIVRSSHVDDELMDDTVYEMFQLYYQRGEGFDLKRDLIELLNNGWDDETYASYNLLKVSDKNYWQEIEE